ncbi:MAG: NAD(P)/FAD-dependent oxidoreductase [Phycisphaerae bacterium]
MARVVILGAGIAGHTAALIVRRRLPREHQVIVVSPKDVYNWLPSNIWVGVGAMSSSEVVVPLQPVYARMGITFVQAKAVEIYPEVATGESAPCVAVEFTAGAAKGSRQMVAYDYLINATGPKLNFAATPGLGPEAFTQSVCTYEHADHAATAFLACIAEMKKGVKKNLVMGMGHGLCTCEGAAFEYVLNVEFELRRHGVRDQASILFITNEAELGDFGVGGMYFKRGGYVVHSRTFAESLFVERGIRWITGAHVQKVEADKIYCETLDGQMDEIKYDFAMLLPPFSGTGLQAFSRTGADITSELFMPNGFMKVDADYTKKEFAKWKAADWPKTYRNPKYSNIFAVGIAFAPPHAISMPRTSARGTPISPAAPRTGMPSAIMGRVVANTIADLILGHDRQTAKTASMVELGAACVASAGSNWWSGTAASMTMFPIVPDFEKFPEYGRDLRFTFGEIGSAGHWIKKILHYMFMYKAKGKPFWWIIPE